MQGLILTCMLLVSLNGLSQALTPTQEYPYSTPLVSSGGYHLYWEYDEESITFEVHVKTTGYVGFGISRTGGMKDADIVIGWVKDGTAYLQDRYADREDVPKLDDSQDWKLLEGSETDTHTILKFRRLLKTCDDKDIEISSGTTKLIWAYKDTEPNTPDQDPPYHGSTSRGTRTMFLLTPPANESPEIPSDAIHVDFFNQNYTLPADDTTYYCQGFSVPKLDVKHHVLMVEPIIQEGNEASVHHILLYGCYHELDTEEHSYESWDDMHGLGGLCYKQNMPTDECDIVIVAWGVGGGNIAFPKHTGFPVGGPEEKLLFIRIEIHYDNPEQRNDIVDSSGLRLWLSPTLREYDMGLLTIGLPANEVLAIPPQFPSVTSLAICSSDCMSMDNSSVDSIHLVGANLHTHLAGKGARLRHFRNGVENPIIMRDEYYDFNFQDFRFLPKEIHFKLGDEFVLECSYKTSDRKEMTWGGDSTREEMCLSFIYYYPKIDLNGCYSTPSLKQTLSYLPENVDEVEWESYKNKLKETNWKDPNIKKSFQEGVTRGEHDIFCTYESKEPKGDTIQMPDYVKLLPPIPPVTCSATGSLITGWVNCCLILILGLFKLE